MSLIGYKILFISFIFIALLIAESKGECNYNDPEQECDCDKNLNSKNECVEACPLKQIPVSVESKPFKVCKTCQIQNLFLSSDKTKCVSECAENEIEDPQNSECIIESECKDIKYVITENDKKEVKEQKKYCNTCPTLHPYNSTKEQHSICVYECQTDQFTDEEDKKCVNDVLECSNKIVSIPSKKCLKECKDATAYSIDNQEGTYCGSCPPTHPYKDLVEDKHVCQKECSESQMIDKAEMRCVTDCGQKIISEDDKECIAKEKCLRFVIDNKKCSSICPKINYLFAEEEEEKTSYQSCNTSCQQYSYFEGEEKKICAKECPQSLIADKEVKKCYLQKKECAKNMSSNGKECIETCGEYEYIEKLDSYSQCRICRDKIRLTKDKSTQCTASCESDEMVFAKFDNQNYFRKCVTKQYCHERMISTKNSNQCSDQCILPEALHAGLCVKECPKGTFYSLESNTCQEGCDQFISSNGKLCLSECERIFEIVDNSIKDTKDQEKEKEDKAKDTGNEGKEKDKGKDEEVKIERKCKRCNEDRVFTTDDSIGECKSIQSKEEQIKAVKENLVDQFKQYKIESPYEIKIGKEEINHFLAMVEERLTKIEGSQEIKTKDDYALAKATFQDAIEITVSFLQSIHPSLSLAPFSLGNSQLKLFAQVAQPGKMFKTSFDSDRIQRGDILTLLENVKDESSNYFNPQMLIVTQLNNIHFINQTDYKKNPHLFIVTQLNEQREGISVENLSQNFNLTHSLPSEQNAKMFVCLSYSQEGVISHSKGVINSSKTQITCEFNYSSALLYDEQCQYVSKKICNQQEDNNNSVEKEVDEENETTVSDGISTNLIIGLFVALGLLLLWRYNRRENIKTKGTNSVDYERYDRVQHRKYSI